MRRRLKNIALAQQVGKRLRVLVSQNNAGIDDSLIGGVVKPRYRDYGHRAAVGCRGAGTSSRSRTGTTSTRSSPRSRRWRSGRPTTRRPMVLVGPTVKGLVAGGPRRADQRARADRRLPFPPLRVQDEQRLLRRAGRDVRAGLRSAVRGHSGRRSGDRGGAPDPVQDQRRRGDVGDGAPAGAARLDRRAAARHRGGRSTGFCRWASTRPRTRFSTSASRWRTCRPSRWTWRRAIRTPARTSSDGSPLFLEPGEKKGAAAGGQRESAPG